RDRPALRLQDERVRAPPRWSGVRARGGEPDDRVPRRLPLRRPALPRRLRARVRRSRARPAGHGSWNVKVMVPFCRTPAEGRRVVAALARNGLAQGKDGLEIYAMCEVPSNVILAEQFLEVFDGFSIGSNDL